MAENKTKPTRQSVEQFLEGIEHETRKAEGFKLLKMMSEL